MRMKCPHYAKLYCCFNHRTYRTVSTKTTNICRIRIYYKTSAQTIGSAATTLYAQPNCCRLRDLCMLPSICTYVHTIFRWLACIRNNMNLLEKKSHAELLCSQCEQPVWLDSGRFAVLRCTICGIEYCARRVHNNMQNPTTPIYSKTIHHQTMYFTRWAFYRADALFFLCVWIEHGCTE